MLGTEIHVVKDCDCRSGLRNGQVCGECDGTGRIRELSKGGNLLSLLGMPDVGESAQLVRERSDDCTPGGEQSGYEKVGIRVGERVIWLGCYSWPNYDGVEGERLTRNEFLEAEDLANALVDGYNLGLRLKQL